MAQSDWSLGLTPERIAEFLKYHGRKGIKTMSALGNNQPAYAAITDEVGQHLLKHVMAKMEDRLNKIIALEADDKDKLEYGILRDIFNEWVEIIYTQRKLADRIQGGQ